MLGCRGLCLLPNVGFVSASHDLTIRVWTMSGQSIAELLGHSAIIYAVAATADGLIASGGLLVGLLLQGLAG